MRSLNALFASIWFSNLLVVNGLVFPLTPVVTLNNARPEVQAILFWMEGCQHCHEVMENVLPPLQEKYGSQLQITLIEVSDMDDLERLYAVAARYAISKEQVGVPFLIIGEQVLIGSKQILAELPGLIERYLEDGGISLPDVPEFTEFLPKDSTLEEICAPAAPCIDPGFPANTGVVGILFTTPDCHDCQLIAGQVLKMAREDYQGRFTVETIDIVTSEDVDYLYQVAVAFGLTQDEVDLPLLIIGDQVLVDAEIPGRLPALLETILEAGGAERPQIPARADMAKNPTVVPHQTPSSVEMQHNGFALAVLILALMAVALVYNLASFALGKTFGLPAWADWLIPFLIIVGIGVAGYLSYVETQLVSAVCGPVGDCNAVQSSPYARLFGVLPVGVLGLLGYLALLAAWLARHFLPRLEKPANLSFWGMVVFAVVFSIYLTYLEPFIIKAVCAWCLASAVIVTLLLLLGTPPAVRYFADSDKDE